MKRGVTTHPRAALRVLLVLGLVIAAPLARALTDQELADQQPHPTSNCSPYDSYWPVPTNDGGTSPKSYVILLGATSTSYAVKFTFGGIALGFKIWHNGTIAENDPTSLVNVSVSAIEDIGGGSWLAVVNWTVQPTSPPGGGYHGVQIYATYATNETFVHGLLCDYPITTGMTGFFAYDTCLWAGSEGCNTDFEPVLTNAAVLFVANGTTGSNATGPPPPPSNLTAAPEASAVNLSWNASANATGYRVYLNGTLLGTVNTTSVHVANLTANVTYAFNVTAFNSGGESAPASVTASPLSCAPVETIDASRPPSIASIAVLIAALAVLMLGVGVAGWLFTAAHKLRGGG